MALFGRNRDILVDYNPENTNEEDLMELRAELAETFTEYPDVVIGGRRLTIIHSGMLDDNGQLIRKKVKKKVKEIKKIVKKERKKKPRETPEQVLRRLEHEVSALAEQLKRGDNK